MRITTTSTVEQIRETFDRVNREEYGGNLTLDLTDLGGVRATRVRVKVGARSGEAGSRESSSGRRGPWACWHAFRDVIGGWFADDPDATVWTAFTTYRGGAHFLDVYPGTADRNVGSLIQPAYLPDMCYCHDFSQEPDYFVSLRAAVGREEA